MAEKEKKLQVKDLTVSFRSTDGKVQAVRGIDFDLYKGETLAIVGESGSGKSVTSKAILGILAGNSIIERGEILYDGKDLLKISEEEFHEIRGDKIAMIFQDPMSSLNPIIKIGRQLTEAMILNGKLRQKESRKAFNQMLKLLQESMIAATSKQEAHKSEIYKEKCSNFDKFEYKHLELEAKYNQAFEAAEEGSFDLDDIIFEIEKNALKDGKYRINKVLKQATLSIHEYVVNEDKEVLEGYISSVKSLVSSAVKSKNYTGIINDLKAINEILKKAIKKTAPNFFAMGYYCTFADQELPKKESVEELNIFLRKYLDDNFMLSFIADAKAGMKWSSDEHDRKKLEAVQVLKKYRSVFAEKELNKATCQRTVKEMKEAVLGGIDKLETVKDSIAYTFGSGLQNEINKYFVATKKNITEAARYARQKKKYDALVASGKTPSMEVVPAAIVDLDKARATMLNQIDAMIEHYEKAVEKNANRNFDADAVAMIDYLKAKASGVVNKVTKHKAKNKAIKLMEEVGIADARKRYNQYPFEFSGGMRQRIVIAIALAADPDILICDEPTTALDVTIQSQILELINKFKKERELTVIFITHDLGVVANMADRIAVMYAGKIVELGTAKDVFYSPAHPYTWALLSSMPDLDTNEKLDAIPGTPPNMIYPPVGDAFAERNKYAMKIDFEKQPPMFKISDTHYAATWLLHPDAPKIEMPKIITDRIERMKERSKVKDGE